MLTPLSRSETRCIKTPVVHAADALVIGDSVLRLPYAVVLFEWHWSRVQESSYEAIYAMGVSVTWVHIPNYVEFRAGH